MKRILIWIMVLLMTVSLINAKVNQDGSSKNNQITFQSSPEEVYNLGIRYMNGTDVKKDMEMAYKLFLKSADMGYAKAQYNMGVIYLVGISVKPDNSQAFKWFEMAAKQNLPDALYMMDLLYEEGPETLYMMDWLDEDWDDDKNISPVGNDAKIEVNNTLGDKLLNKRVSSVPHNKTDEHSQVSYENEKHTIMDILYGTDRKKNPKKSDWEYYYTGQAGKLKYGVAEVSIPKIHNFGVMERARNSALLGFVKKEKIGEHVLIDKLETIDEKKFLSFLKGNLYNTGKKINPNKSDLIYMSTVEKEFLSFLKTKLYNVKEKDIMIFIHGYNVSFAEAIRRTAQISYDLDFKGIPMAYSWPSREKKLGYFYDGASVQYTVPHLVAFFKTIINGKSDANIHVIGRSMGARVLTNAIKEISFIYPGKHVFKNIILAVPDIDRDVFKFALLPYITKTTDKITLYVSSDDRLSGESLGQGGDDVFVDEGLDTIDAIGIDSFWGHSYFEGDQEGLKILMQEEVFLQLDTGGHTAQIQDVIATKSGDIITTSDDKTIRVWDSKTGEEKRKILGQIGQGPKGMIYTMALSPDEEQLAVGGDFKNNEIRIYHYPTGILIKVLKAHTSAVFDLSYSPDSKYLISGSADKTAKIWEISKNFSLIDTITHHTNHVYAVKIVKQADRYLAITAGYDKQIALYDMKKRKVIKSKTVKYKLQYLAVASNCSDGRIAVCGFGKEILIYDFDFKFIKKIKSETKPVGLSYSPNGKLLIAGTNIYPRDINIYNKENNYSLITTFKKHKNFTTKAVTFFNNNLALTAGGENNEICIWNSKTAEVKRKIEGVGATVWSVGVKGDTIGWRNKERSMHNDSSWNMLKTLNLKTFRVNSEKQIVKNLKKISTTYGNLSLTHIRGENYKYNNATLILKKDQKEITKITRGSLNGYTHSCYGFYKNYIISGGENGYLKIYNQKGKEIANLVGHTGEILSIALDGDKLVSGSRDQTIRIWDLSRFKKNNKKQKITLYPQLNIFISKTNDYIAWTEEGYFTASEEGMQYLYFHLNQGAKKEAKVIPVKKLYDHFFRPDLIQLKLSGDEKAYQKATQGLDFKSALQNPPPTVKFNGTTKKTDKNKITLSFDIQDEDGGIGLIRVYQEGKLIQTIGEGKVNKQSANIDTLLEQEILDKTVKIKQKTYIASLSKSIEGNLTIAESIAPVQPATITNKAGTYTIDLDLIAGSNEIGVEAFNKTNTVTSYRETITINADIPKRKPKLYAIVAGVNKFEAPNVHNLKYSRNDAKDIKEIAEHQMNKLYEHVKVTYLEGQDLTKANILKAAKEIAKKAKLEDTVIFYISTHGRAAGGKLYLVPYNNKNVKNWIDFEQIFKSIQSIKALNQIFVIDTCESGKANDIVSSVYDSRASVLARSSGVHMLLASTKGTFAFEHSDPTIHNGVFTYKILQAIRNKTTDTNKDKTISILELSKKLKEPTNNTDYQYPIIRNVGSDVGLVSVE